jgi:hypothetical protein
VRRHSRGYLCVFQHSSGRWSFLVNFNQKGWYTDIEYETREEAAIARDEIVALLKSEGDHFMFNNRKFISSNFIWCFFFSWCDFFSC